MLLSAPVHRAIPSELLHAIVLEDLSPESLARWCLVSRSTLNVAGPVLYKTVAIKQAKHVMPFLTRLIWTPADSLLLPIRRIRRLELHALPPMNELYPLEYISRPPLNPLVEGLSLAVRWHDRKPNDFTAEAEAREQQVALHQIPALLRTLEPAVYEEIDPHSAVGPGKLHGIFLRIYLDSFDDDTVDLDQIWDQVYAPCIQASRYTEEIKAHQLGFPTMLATAEEMATADLSLEEISVPLQKLRGQVEVLSVPLAELPEDGATWGDAEALVDLAEAWNNNLSLASQAFWDAVDKMEDERGIPDRIYVQAM